MNGSLQLKYYVSVKHEFAKNLIRYPVQVCIL